MEGREGKRWKEEGGGGGKEGGCESGRQCTCQLRQIEECLKQCRISVSYTFGILKNLHPKQTKHYHYKAFLNYTQLFF